MRILSAVLLACLGFTAAADDVYRWVDKDGVVHYADKPQSPGDKPVTLPHLQTYAPGELPPGFAPGAGKTAESAAPAISISSPAPEETIRDADGKFTVTVAASPQPGQGLIYYLDGVAQNQEPTPSTALLFSGAERGEHHIAVALVAGSGQELARSAEVTVNVKPPALRR